MHTSPLMRTPARAAAPHMLATPSWARPAIAAVLAAALTVAPMPEAALADSVADYGSTMLIAGRSGGRVGGRVGGSATMRSPSRAPSSVAPRSTTTVAPRAAPAPTGARTTNVYVAPSPMMGGYGMGMGYGGYGYGGGGGMGMYLGLSLAETFLREQQRQAYLQQQLRVQQELGRDQAQIAQLQAELQQQNAKMDSLKQQNGGQAPTVDAETEATLKLKIQLAEQQKELEQLKATNAAAAK